jgi:YihY family inner membrane protein
MNQEIDSSTTEGKQDQVEAIHSPQPPASPRPGSGWKGDITVLYRYLTQPEVHTYAFSVAANSILAFYPMVLMLYATVSHITRDKDLLVSLHTAILGIVQFFLPLLPAGMDMVIRNIDPDAHRQTLNLISLFSLLIGMAGIFLPLEVALNRVWGVTKHRNMVMNQVVSFGLAFGILIVAIGSVLFNALQRYAIIGICFGHTDNFAYRTLIQGATVLSGTVAGILFFFLVYWILPNRKIPSQAVLPTAIVSGLIWEVARVLYILLLPKLDLDAAYGIFRISASLIIWSYVSGLIMLGGAQFSANRHAIRLTHEADVEEYREANAAHS